MNYTRKTWIRMVLFHIDIAFMHKMMYWLKLIYICYILKIILIYLNVQSIYFQMHF